MKTLIASLLVVLATTTAYADPVKTEYETRVGKLEFVNSFPTQETTDKLREAADITVQRKLTFGRYPSSRWLILFSPSKKI
jgi:hypothetical protein